MSSMHRSARVAASLGIAAAVLTLAGCGGSGDTDSGGSAQGDMSGMSGMSGMSATSSSGDDSTSSGSSSAMAMITIKDYDYSGAQTVRAGAMIMVKNEDSAAHTITADSGSAFDVTIPPGGTATFKAPATPGTYPYHCTYHAEMHGTLTVS